MIRAKATYSQVEETVESLMIYTKLTLMMHTVVAAFSRMSSCLVYYGFVMI